MRKTFALKRRASTAVQVVLATGPSSLERAMTEPDRTPYRFYLQADPAPVVGAVVARISLSPAIRPD